MKQDDTFIMNSYVFYEYRMFYSRMNKTIGRFLSFIKLPDKPQPQGKITQIGEEQLKTTLIFLVTFSVFSQLTDDYTTIVQL